MRDRGRHIIDTSANYIVPAPKISWRWDIFHISKIRVNEPHPELLNRPGRTSYTRPLLFNDPI